MATGGANWEGTDRFEIVSRLGEGGMGVVYEAFDRQRGERVALKTLRHFDADALYRFKQEFRTLADVLHPNLVHLHELVSDEKDHVFFTMELVEGTDFLDYVRGPNDSPFAPRSHVQTVPPEQRRAPQTPPPTANLGALADPMAPEPERLQRALIQLVEGVAALHAAGKLHRDLKPSNVRVTPEGRVVILDFGVATDLRRRASAGDDEANGELVGTASYMAPEQALGEAPAPASDWYSVGAILFEAIVGQALHVGPLFEVLNTKLQVDPTPPSARVKGVPPHLDALCLELMSIDPAERPTAAEILRRLGYTSNRSSPRPPAEAMAAMILVGREVQLGKLHDALATSQGGHAVSARVSGPAGMGKSALGDHFLDELEARGDVLVLRGRTYERESVPYKVFDSVVDALTQHLIFLDESKRELPMPVGIEALAQIFPVLRRVQRIEEDAESKLDSPTTRRQRAFAALRALFDSLARNGPVVVFIDDVHWGDSDSAALLLELVRSPGAPPILFLTTHRSEDARASPFLAALSARWPEETEICEVEVGPLSANDARHLALALLGAGGQDAQRAAESIALEAGGSPFLIEELAQAASVLHRVAAQDPSAHRGAISLEEVIAERASRLPEGARRMLDVIATAGRPLSVSIVGEAADAVDSAAQLVALLRSRRFVRAGLRAGIETVETSHNRIGETIIARMSPEAARGHHARLAQAMEAAHSDPEAIATHLLGAGDRDRAGHFAERAADQALQKLAFARAARLFQLAIDTESPTSEARQPLLVRLAKSSEWAGNADMAARAYLAAAELAQASERVQLESAAASQLIAAGRIDEGAAAFRRVLAACGIAVPKSRFWAVFLTGVYRFAGSLLLLFGFREKDHLPSDKDRELNVLHGMSRALAIVDLSSSYYLRSRYLVGALRSGSRFHMIRSAILEAGALGGRGGREGRKEKKLLSLARQLAEKGGDEQGLGYYELTYGIGEYLRGRWRSCVEWLERAQVTLVAVRAWQANVNVFRIYALVSMGDLPEVKARTKALLADAERRGDRYTAANLLASHPTSAWLASDDVDAARRQLKGAIADWSRGRFLVQHWQAMLWEAETHLYVGNGEDAWMRLAQDELRYAASPIARIQLVRAWTFFIRGRSAIASLPRLDEAEHRTRLRAARRAQRGLAKEGMPWTDALAAILAASIASVANDTARAERELRHAITLAQRAEMALHAAAVRHRLGLLLGSESGKAFLEEAETIMRARGVRVPAGYAQMLVPGSWQAEPTDANLSSPLGPKRGSASDQKDHERVHHSPL
jgi:hypothetical protein